MEPFEITVDGILYTVHPQEDGTFIIMDIDSQIALLIPESDDRGLYWTSADLVAPILMEKIGEAIERHDM